MRAPENFATSPKPAKQPVAVPIPPSTGKALPPTSPLRQRNQQGSLSAKNERLLRRFEDDLALRYAERTVPEYVAHVRGFLAWAEAKGLELAGLRRQDLAAYQSELFALRKRDGKPYSAGFHVNRFSALRSFFGFLTRRLLILHNPIAGLERPRLETRLPRTILTPREVKKIIEKRRALARRSSCETARSSRRSTRPGSARASSSSSRPSTSTPRTRRCASCAARAARIGTSR